ncbi:hypothetical protein yc1106_08844 [Curvularia clavata]|uniref:Uncharacterized protein n=1 Tax=Curvularia clavata TaxID=95742 RepID=A0A9Q8ZG39_CURCL|nr:hypothetical protein yc1106_08844 [Curvularia clavata]
MAYEPVGRSQGPRISTSDDMEPRTRYDAGSYNSEPSATDSQYCRTEDGGKGATWSSRETIKDQWPLQSQKLAPMTPMRGFIMVFDVILASMPIMFIALAIVAARLNGQEVSDYGTKLKETLLISPTLFPLLFAALMGRFFRHFGLWLAQRGTTLGRLEQLVGCQSVFSALERQISLGTWSVVGVASILIWLLSPVGGQSALRLLDQETGVIRSTHQLRYLNPMTFMDSIMSSSSFINEGRISFTSITLAALLSSSRYQNTSMDMWGNVKLPLYRSIENSTSDEWKIVPQLTSQNVTYASLIGIPVLGLSNGVSNFTVRARQWDVTCSSNKEVDKKPSNFGDEYPWQVSIMTNATVACMNGKQCVKTMCARYPCPIQSISLGKKNPDVFTISNCDLSFGNFEAAVKCTGKACAVEKMRKVPLLDDKYPIGYDIAIRSTFVTNQMMHMPIMDVYKVSMPQARGSTTLERWIKDPSNFIGQWAGNVGLWTLSPAEFGDRFTILYNTFWQSTYAMPALAGNVPASTLETGWMNDTTTTFNTSFVPTEAFLTTDTKSAYKTNWKWFTALLVCSVILLIASYTALVLKYITIAPDIIGYASSLTILNPYVPTPTGGTTLNGLERAALLRDMPVRIGDVTPNEPVGVIALAKADTGQVARLDRQRSYI